jgi:outer membrane beta-barrel protein
MRLHQLLSPVAGLLLFSSTALADETASTTSLGDPIAQDDEDDDLDDILGTGDDSGESVSDEVEALRRGEIGDTVGAREEAVLNLEQADNSRRVIKTIQAKNFLKINRWEISPHVAFVSNDPFLNRYILGTGIGYHVTEIFAIEGMLDFSPDLGEGDWKPLTTQLVQENHVSPDISKLNLFGEACFVFSPIYGKAAISGRKIINFDIYGKFGMGATRTADDLAALQAEGDSRAEATQFQVHPTTNFGGGARVIFNDNLAVRVEGRSMVYIETVNATTLEMKNNFILQFAASFFIPNMRS